MVDKREEQWWKGAWGSIVVKALRYKSEGLRIDPQWCRWGLFPILPTEPCALGIVSASKNEYQETPGGKDSRWVRVTNFITFIVPKVENIRSLNLPDPQGPA
jgi:hypothetical protein